MVYVPELDAPARPATGRSPAAGVQGPGQGVPAKIKPYSAAIEDAVTSVLSAKTYDEVRSADGKERVKREIKDRVQRIVADEVRGRRTST